MVNTLHGADWLQRADLRTLMNTLGEGQARYVGGAVRDTLLGLPVKDIDVATLLRPDVVIEKLADAGIRTVPTGIDHGTVTALAAGGPVEITTLRRDVATDGRRATIAFADDWREDAARRDFTINALYADEDGGSVLDFFGGLADLDAGIVRFIGDPEERIREDHLRILRYFRFQARFGRGHPDKESERACAALAATLRGLSRERIGMEMMALLALPDPAPTIARMAELGVLEEVLPEGDPVALAGLVASEREQDIPPDPLRRLAALLPADPSLAEQVAARFRLSGAQKKRLVQAAARGKGDASPRELAYRLGHSGALDRLLLAGRDAGQLHGWAIPPFPLKGGDIVARGVRAGPEVARLLRRVEDRWIDEGFPDRARVEVMLAQEIASSA